MMDETIGIDDISILIPNPSIDEAHIEVTPHIKKKRARLTNYSRQEAHALVMVAWESVRLVAIPMNDQNIPPFGSGLKRTFAIISRRRLTGHSIHSHCWSSVQECFKCWTKCYE